MVRRLAGYGRLSGLAAGGAVQRLYESARLYVNFFQPSFMLASKQRNGARVLKSYYPPLTPYQQMLASDAVDATVKLRLREQFAALDPVALLNAIREVSQDLLARSNKESHAGASPPLPSVPRIRFSFSHSTPKINYQLSGQAPAAARGIPGVHFGTE